MRLNSRSELIKEYNIAVMIDQHALIGGSYVGVTEICGAKRRDPPVNLFCAPSCPLSEI